MTLRRRLFASGRRALAALVLCLPVLAAALPVAAPPAAAQEAAPAAEEMLAGWEEQNARVEDALARTDGFRQEEIFRLRDALEKQRTAMREERARLDRAAQPIEQQLEALGPRPEDGAAEAEGVAAQRSRLEGELAVIDAARRRVDAALARSAALIGRLLDIRAQQFTEDLLSAGPTVFSFDTWDRAWRDVMVAALRVGAEVRRTIGDDAFAEELGERLVEPLVLFVLGLVLGVLLRRFAERRLLAMVGPDDSFGRRSAIGFGLTVTRILLPALALFLLLTAAITSGFLGTFTLPFGIAVARATAVIVAIYALSLAYFSPRAPSLRISDFPDDSARRAARLTILLSLVIAADRFLQTTAERLGAASESFSAYNFICLTVGGWLLWRLARVIRSTAPASVQAARADTDAETEESTEDQSPEAIGREVHRALGLVFHIIAVAAPVLAAFGYVTAARYTFYPVLASTALLLIGVILLQVVRGFVESRLAGREGARMHRLRLLPLLTSVILALLASPILVLIWGGDRTDIASLWGFVAGGFVIGGVTISLGDVATLVIVFAVGYVLTRIVQNIVGRAALPNAGVDSGAAAAIHSGIGYVGIIIAALVAVSAAGLDLSNLALVVGALSVGIGLGLQNIVNNFVSGIVLLIERPIKVGDWIELPSGMGYVKKINVRATEIQTFDRSSLFVPNSELISGPVTNWTHSNAHGRIIVKVGVAYGSDAAKVERILLEIAEAHTMVLRRPGPYVIMTGFGTDALDFEIRGVLRDVNWILNVRSDILRTVYDRFRAEGVEIPFRQQDVHLRNAEELGEAIGHGVRSGIVRNGARMPEEPREREQGGDA